MTAEDTTRAAYAAARSGAAWKDRSADGRLEVRGADRVTWLQGLLTNDVATLSPGQGCYAAYLTPQGRMIADLRVLVRDDRLWLDTPGEATDALLNRLEAFVITEDVELRDLTAALARLTVCGPAAPAAVAAALVREVGHRASCARALDGLPEHAHLAQAWSGAEVVVAATRDAGVPGFDIYADLTLRDAIVA
ncbi:MAG: hypothetical protein MUF60_06195, partial [Vicinamibacterales bacterium]|nr:hypothetical protein [Vicinamibacterales bacterium]